MDRLTGAMVPAQERPIKVVQFGEGNFLRAFVDYMIDIANEKMNFNGSVAIVKPISFGSLERFHDQDCRYTVLLRGLKDGERYEETRVVTSVAKAVDCYTEYDAYMALAELLRRQQHHRGRHHAGRDGRLQRLPAEDLPGQADAVPLPSRGAL